MAEYTETELKLRFLDPGCWEQIFSSTVITERADPLSFRQEILEAQYYDTPSHSLQKSRLAFRIRREGGVWLATVKNGGMHSGGLHQRGEWTVPIAEPIANPEIFADTPIGPVLTEVVGEEELIALFTTRFERKMLNLHAPDGSIVELAADQGEISTTDGQSPILEIELELKSGNVGALLHFGADLASELPLLPEWRSKYFRALQLAGLTNQGEVPIGECPSINAKESADSQLTGLLVFRIQCVLNALEQFLQLPEDPETLHHVRIQLRWLRSLVAFSEPFIPEEIYVKFQEGLKNWASSMVPLRELDVALAAWDEIMDSNGVIFSVGPVLGDKLAEKRKVVATQIHKELNKGQATPLLMEMWAWLADNQLRFQATMEESTEAMFQPLAVDFIRERLAKWLDHMVETDKNIDLQDDEMLHMLRIRVKKIRYAFETLIPILPKKTEKILEQLKELQSSLGYLHDMHVSHLLLQDLLRSQSSRLLYRDTGVFAGWQAHKALSVHRKAKKQWKRFLRIEQKWNNPK